jgi:hypothetical protein
MKEEDKQLLAFLRDTEPSREQQLEEMIRELIRGNKITPEQQARAGELLGA